MAITTIFKDLIDRIRMFMVQSLHGSKDPPFRREGGDEIIAVLEEPISIEQGLFLYMIDMWETFMPYSPAIAARINALMAIATSVLERKHGFQNPFKFQTIDGYVYDTALLEVYNQKVEEGLIEKNSRGEYSLTENGRMVTQAIKNNTYHSMTSFDDKFKKQFETSFTATIDLFVIPLLKMEDEDKIQQTACLLVLKEH